MLESGGGGGELCGEAGSFIPEPAHKIDAGLLQGNHPHRRELHSHHPCVRRRPLQPHLHYLRCARGSLAEDDRPIKTLYFISSIVNEEEFGCLRNCLVLMIHVLAGVVIHMLINECFGLN
ncbi:hypothetical protein KSP40_PGU021556 [Platanthera guangdongensis]|uniref:Uncharacterized protein n=1 Tax=Platanthera guangdongensis TaxID=2320717 RepID=A0ABR2MEF1_9ASPA